MKKTKEQLKIQKRFLNLRLKGLKKILKEKNLDAFLISKLVNRYYFTGWYGDEESGYLLVSRDKDFFITDSRYVEHAQNSLADFVIIEQISSLAKALSEITGKFSIKRVGFESHDLSFYSYRYLKKNLSKVSFIPLDYMIEQIRSIKDADELAIIEKAASITSQLFINIFDFIKPGISEKEISWQMVQEMRDLGSDGPAWEPIMVASGKNSSMPHHRSGDRKLSKGDMVLLDFGVSLLGYKTDMTRVVFLGRPRGEIEEAYNWLLKLQEMIFQKLRSGVKISNLDKDAKTFLRQKTIFGYKHALGHGIGLEVHEKPVISKLSNEKLSKGNVITIEPGIYVPGKFGLRIEDMFLIGESKADLLTNAPKSLKEVVI